VSKILKKQQKDIEILEIDVFLIFILKNGHFYRPEHHFLNKSRNYSTKLLVFDVFLLWKNENGHFDTHTISRSTRLDAIIYANQGF